MVYIKLEKYFWVENPGEKTKTKWFLRSNQKPQIYQILE